MCGRSHSVLHYAAEYGQSDTVRALCKAGFDVAARNADNETALHCACSSGHLGAVKALLEAGADPSAEISTGLDRDSVTPFSIGCSEANDDIVHALLDAGLTDGPASQRRATLLYLAISSCRVSIVERLVRAGADVNAACFGVTPIQAVALLRSPAGPAIIRLLAKAGADVNFAGGTGTPLKEAARMSYEDSVAALLECGADVHKRDIGSGTALIALYGACTEYQQRWKQLSGDF
jgi:ankyrin repeat protein